jgi:hypothetical protein
MFVKTDAVSTTQSQLKSTLTNVFSTCATRRTENIPETLTVTTTIHVPKTAVTLQLDCALTKVRPVMTTMLALLTAAILHLETASTLLFHALMETHVPLIPAMLKRDVSTLLNTTLNNWRKMTCVTNTLAIPHLDL